MKKKRRVPWGQTLSLALSLLAGCGCGVLVARRLDRVPLSPTPLALRLLGLLGLLYLAFLVQIVLHEAGHLLCGLLSGYRFCSFRVGSLMWLREGGRLRLRRLRVAGTGGQCLMAPPDLVDGRIPVALYNFGGALMNLLAALLALGLSLLVPAASLWALFLQLLAAAGFLSALMNGIPLRLGVIDNDGYNALSLGRDPAALRAFWVQMKVAEAQAQGLRLREMPAEWFAPPPEEALDNAMTAALGVLACNRLVDEGRFAEADAAMSRLMARSAGLVGLHRGLLTCDRVYVELLGQARPEALDALLPPGQRKFLRQMKRFPSVLRTQYAYALLAERDPAKARRFRAQFERIAKTYPYPADIRSERELMALADARAAGPGGDG